MKLDVKKLIGLRVLAADVEANQGSSRQDTRKLGAKIGGKLGGKDGVKTGG